MMNFDVQKEKRAKTNIVQLWCSHKSLKTRSLFKLGIQASTFLKENPNFSKEDVLNSQESALCEKFGIPFLLSKQIVRNPDLNPFYLIVPKEHLHYHLKKSHLEEDSYVRIPFLDIKVYFQFGPNVRSVESARATKDTLFMDVVVGPDFRTSRSAPKPSAPVFKTYDEDVRLGVFRRSKAREQWHQKRFEAKK